MLSEPSTSSCRSSEEKSGDKSALRMVETLQVGIREGRNLLSRRPGASFDGRSLFCLLKLDKEEIYTSTHVAKSAAPVFSDDVEWEVPPGNFRQLHLYVCEQSSGRVPHPFLRLSLKKSDIIKGKVCLEVSSEDCDGSGDSPTTNRRIKIKMLDFAGLSLPSGGSKPVDLYALVTVQCGNRRIKTEKLKIPQKYQRSRRLWESAESGLSSSTELSGKTTPDLPTSASAGPVCPSGLLQSDPPTLVMELDSSQVPQPPTSRSLADSAIWRSNNQDNGSSSPSTSEPPSPCSLDEPASSRSFHLPPKARPAADSSSGGQLELRISLWHDIGVFNSFFHGQVHIPLSASSSLRSSRRSSAAPQWYCLKPRDSDKSSSNHCEGELRLRIGYRVKHILPLREYGELWETLLASLPASETPSSSDSTPSSPVKSLPPRPFCESGRMMGLSALGLLEHLPESRLDDVTRPLVRIFLQADKLRSLVRQLAGQEIALTTDVATLFRGPSLASRLVSASMKLLGGHYLFQTLKQPVDRIFTERRTCEIDPGRLSNPSDLEENTQNLFEYTQLMIGRVADSNHRCPRELRNILGDIRAAAKFYHPGKAGVELLAVSSFILLRFFSAAIYDPKHFGIKRDNPDPVVARTLALVSKILQKLSNYVVCGCKPVAKEPWLQPILDRFMDESHAKSMAKYLELVSEPDGDGTSVSSDSISILREGPLTQKAEKGGGTGCFEWAALKRSRSRHVILTESDIVWGKSKESLSGRMSLDDLVELGPVEEEERVKNAFVVATSAASLTLQAPSQLDAQDWLSAIKRQLRRKRSSGGGPAWRRWEDEVELERELETLHMVLFANANLMHRWKCVLDGAAHPSDLPPLPSLLTADLAPSALAGSARVPLDMSMVSLAPSMASSLELSSVSLEEPGLPPGVLEARKAQLRATLEDLLRITFGLEMAHTNAIESYFRQTKYGSKDLPIGDDNYLLLKSRIKDARGLRRLRPPAAVLPLAPVPLAQASPPPLPARNVPESAAPPPLPARLHPSPTSA